MTKCIEEHYLSHEVGLPKLAVKCDSPLLSEMECHEVEIWTPESNCLLLCPGKEMKETRTKQGSS